MGRRFVNRHSKQPKVGGTVRGDDIAERMGGGSAGGTPSNRLGWRMERQKNNNQKYIVAFCGLHAMFFNTTTNQKRAAAMEGSMEGRRDEQGAQGKQGTIVLMAL